MKPTANEVQAVVERHLAQAHIEDPDGAITLEIDASYIVCEPYAWHVRVRPSREPDRQWRFYEELAVIAENIAMQDHLEVHFIPGAPLKSRKRVKAAIAA